jgi:EAL domain-containing protein (putative c-di-GMP-specific phosphodiesterase class I)
MGKSLQPLNAIAVRQPANTPPSAGPAVPTSAPNEPVTPESLGWQLRAALPPLRLHSVSLYDEQANVLWLSEGALGPDEHNVVVESIDALSSDTSLTCYESGLEDGRVALSLPVRAPHGGLVGLAMILADIKSVTDGVLEKMTTPQIRTVLQKVAVLLKPAQPRSSAGESPVQVLELAPESPAASAPVAAAPAAAAALVARSAPPTLSPQAVDDILEFELTPDVAKPVTVPKAVAPVASPAGATTASSAKPAPTPLAAVPTAAPPPVAKAASPAAIPTADVDDDLRLPSLDAPAAPTSFGNKVAAFPSPAAAPKLNGNSAAASAPALAAVPTLGAASAHTVDSSSATVDATSSATPPVNTSVTVTSKAVNPGLTGTSKMLAGAADPSKGTGATSTTRVLAMPEGMSLILEVQPFSKLRTGGRTRRYEVLARASQPNRAPPGIDKIALQQLLAWMSSNRGAWNLEPTSFTLNLSIATLEDERFPQFVASNLKTHGIAADNIGFEIAEPLCLQRRAQVERFMTLCDKLGCFVVIDDFSLDSSIVPLLRSKALRLVKIDPKLTSVALKDKLAQAMVVAIAQAVKVLGIHCAAKRVESQAALQWLTAIGCDFAQGPVLAQVQALESLGSAPPSPTPGPAAA